MATLILMPRLSPTMEEGVLVKWTKKEGDAIAPGDIIAEVETDKANMDFPLEDEGVLLKLLVAAGATVKLGDPVAVLGAAGEDPASAMAGIAPAPAAVAAAPAAVDKAKPATETVAAKPATETVAEQPAPKAAAPVAAPTADTSDGRIKSSPLARKIAADKGVDLAGVTGTGPGGRVVKRDVVDAKPAAVTVKQTQVTPGVDTLTPASPMRKTIAKRLVDAKREIPHIYLVADATVDKLLVLREELNTLRAEDGVKISVNDLVVKAMALALRRIPEANVSWTADGLLRHGRVDISVAVSVTDGLITPVLRNAAERPLAELSTEMKALAERARAKKLKPEEYTGGTASVTNLGMFGVREFCAIINPPEAVILAVGATEKRPMVVEVNGRDEVTVARRMTLTLSCDHRVVDGVLGAKLLAEVVRFLEHPLALVL